MFRFICGLCLLSLISLTANLVSAADRVVVIPLHGSSSSASGQAYVPQTGQDTSLSQAPYDLTFNNAGDTNAVFATDDGGSPHGVDWPTPRFTNNGDGTVTDNLTDLVWLQDPSCYASINLQTALENVQSLANGTCNLSDGSQAGDWHIANVNELTSLLDWGFADPKVSNADGTGQWTEGDPFSNLQSAVYNSSTLYFASSTSDFWGVVGVSFTSGLTSGQGYSTNANYWPVRIK